MFYQTLCTIWLMQFHMPISSNFYDVILWITICHCILCAFILIICIPDGNLSVMPASLLLLKLGDFPSKMWKWWHLEEPSLLSFNAFGCSKLWLAGFSAPQFCFLLLSEGCLSYRRTLFKACFICIRFSLGSAHKS